MRFNKFVFSLVFFFTVLPGISQGLQSQVSAILKQNDMQGASFGLCVLDMSSGEKLFTSNEKQGLLTASSLKAVTTSTALLQLGESFRFRTDVWLIGKNAGNGTFRGDLVIRGNGDPSLGSEKFGSTAPEKFLAYVLKNLQNAGINHITGQIYIDGSSHETALAVSSWQWMDIGNYFGAGPWGVNWRDNMYRLYFSSSSSSPGDSTTILKTSPAVPGMEIINEVTCGPKGSGDNCYIYGMEYSNQRWARGTIPPGKSEFSVKGSLPDAAQLLADELSAFLNANAIVVDGAATTSRLQAFAHSSDEDTVAVATWNSPTLKDLIAEINITSNNLYAEALHKYLGYVYAGLGSNENGNEAIMSYWKNLGIGPGGWIVSDGCGLSRCNSISAENLARMFYYMSQQTSYSTFKGSLPVAGKSGTLSTVGKETALEGNLSAKSGSMNKVRSYGGYLTTVSGKQVCFAFMFNYFQSSSSGIRNTMQELMLGIYNHY